MTEQGSENRSNRFENEHLCPDTKKVGKLAHLYANTPNLLLDRT